MTTVQEERQRYIERTEAQLELLRDGQRVLKARIMKLEANLAREKSRVPPLNRAR